MRPVTAVLSVATVVLMAAGLVAQAKPSFAGEWKIAADPDNGGGRGGPGIDLTTTQNATAMTVEYRAGGQAPAPGKLTYNLMARRAGSSGPPRTPSASASAPTRTERAPGLKSWAWSTTGAVLLDRDRRAESCMCHRCSGTL